MALKRRELLVSGLAVLSTSFVPAKRNDTRRSGMVPDPDTFPSLHFDYVEKKIYYIPDNSRTYTIDELLTAVRQEWG